MKLTLPNICVFLLMVAGVLLFALTPDMPIELSQGGDAEHLFAFTVLSSLALFFWPNAIPHLVWSLLVGFGGVIELLQGWMAMGRQAQWSDWFVDIFAVTLTMTVVTLVRLIRNLRVSEAV